MIEQIKQFFNNSLLIDGEPGSKKDTEVSIPHDEHGLKLITAALLIEVSRADVDIDAAERTRIVETLRDTFNLNTEELDALIELAEQQVQESISLYQFTRRVNDFYAYDQKLTLISSMWQVAYADKNLDRYEEHLIRKVADLTYVTHQDFIRLKQDVRSAFGD